MEDLRELQRQKWLHAKAREQETAKEAPEQTPDVPDVAVASSRNAASAAGPGPSEGPAGIRRVHILPVGSLPASGQSALEILTPWLEERRQRGLAVRSGQVVRAAEDEFVLVKCDPDEGVLVAETDYFFDGAPLVRYEKVQFIGLWDFTSSSDRDASALFRDYISPHYTVEARADQVSIVSLNETFRIKNLDFTVGAVDPCPPEVGILDKNTVIYVDWDQTPEFERIHIVPFQDTLPHAYDFDVFGDYLKPYLQRNKHVRLQTNDHFTYQSVQFKVVCAEPSGPARIGANTTIYCEGVLHPSLRNLLPPELLEQLSHLPPGLQMLLLNTEALAGGYEERLMEVQEMLSHRRGMSNDAISQVETLKWSHSQHAEAQGQCMVCLSNFEEEEEVRRLPCSHLYHQSCIDEWLRRCTDCPICKSNVDRAVRQY